ncbi:MAG: hypothetical protein KF764_03490 [Labilithrix sp.]|nr:hypothetical protein [Labilithrix sp.]MBX3221104.1 hypothetical protein [Labilithrix sp.]
MVSLRSALSRVLVLAALGLPAAGVLVPSDAAASVSIAVGFDVLVKDADAVAVITPGEHTSVWEDGRIYTYTKVHVDRGVAGDVGAGADGWVRTMGGVVGKVGQLVDGEPVFVKDKASLVFMRKFKAGGVYEVSARAQGQYPVTIDEATKQKRLLRSTAVGMLLPPKAPQPATQAPPVSGSVQPQSGSGPLTDAAKIRLAQDVMHDKPLDEVAREIATAWKRLHPVDAKTK